MERLQHLITVLAAVPASDLDMCSWFEEPWQIESCGTAGCAFGYAALDPVFNKQGLGRFQNTVVYAQAGRRYIVQGFAAAERFFGITQEESNYIFMPTSYQYIGDELVRVPVALVIGHIEEVISKYQTKGDAT